MNVLIEMSVEVYDNLLDNCDQSCAEYYTLTKANIVFRWKEDHQLKLMRIFCGVNEATRVRYGKPDMSRRRSVHRKSDRRCARLRDRSTAIRPAS